jgi:hypothetical protein
VSDDDMTHDTEAGGSERPFTFFMLETKGKSNWRSMSDTGTEILRVPDDTRLPEWAACGHAVKMDGHKAPECPYCHIARLEAFARELLALSDFRNDIDGGDFQDLAIKHGILRGVEVTEPCSPVCNCAECDDFPQTCYLSTLPEVE